jgi:restriction system protein
MNAPTNVPSYSDLLWPTLRAVREMGDSGTIGEIVEKVIESEGFTDEQQGVPHGDGPRTEIEYRLAWARTYLKGMGALDGVPVKWSRLDACSSCPADGMRGWTRS